MYMHVWVGGWMVHVIVCVVFNQLLKMFIKYHLDGLQM